MTPDEDLRHAFDALSDRLRDTIAREVQQTSSLVATRVADLQPMLEEPGSLPRLLQGMRRIDAARSLTAVLDALVDGIAGDGVRVALLLVRAARVRSWRADGFAAALLPV